MATSPQKEDINKDLGLGSRVAQLSGLRFLNRDGSFNVGRRGLSFIQSLNPYHALLTISWLRFFLVVVTGYFLTNAAFGLAYALCGPDSIRGLTPGNFGEEFLQAFFFSVQTLATIGYGQMSPAGVAANILVTIEGLVGLLGFALATGLLFARFSRPTADIIFSRHAIMAPYGGGTAFEFRIANARTNQLIEVEATVVLSRIEKINAQPVRRFYPLTLERTRVMFMPLHWVIVHPIDTQSPLFNVTKRELDDADAEFLILLTGTDETFAQIVHTRSSYKFHEVIWNVRFADMFQPTENGAMSVDLRKIHDIIPVS